MTIKLYRNHTCSIKTILLSVLLLLGVGTHRAAAQQQYEGFCAAAKIEILQELTLERIGFLATLEVSNNDAVDPITGFTASLRFTKPQSGGAEDDSTDDFWVRQPELVNISGVDGDGNIAPGATAIVKWFIVPKTGAGGQDPAGARFYVHCDLAGNMRGEIIPDQVMFAIPDQITVKPEPELEITYFQPRDVQGDDPYTEAVEAPIPFTLGVLIKNSGYGAARGVVIRSEQPRIVENKQNLLLIARLIGCRVMDLPLDRATLTVDVGDLEPGQSKTAAWDMITSLSGTFTEFKASYTHAPEFGGEETSLIRSMDAHFILHEVLNDRVGRDRVRDFLADTDRDTDQLPDALYESEGHVLPVNLVSNTGIIATNGGWKITGTSMTDGAVYLRINDPAQNRRKIGEVLRADGTRINSNNYWTSTRYLKEGNTRLDELHIFDIVTAGSLEYEMSYEVDQSDTSPPETTLEFSGEHSLRDGTNYITRTTQLYFLSEDASPVSIYYKTDPADDWLPAYPFSLPLGTTTIFYRAVDAAMNEEDVKSAVVHVLDPAEDGTVLTLNSDRSTISLLADLASARPGQTRITFNAPSGPLPRTVQIEIFSEIKAWPRISGVPTSPTLPAVFELNVSGEAVEFYKWRLNGGVWSEDTAGASALQVDAITPGDYLLEVIARSALGDYPNESEALTASWTVVADSPTVHLTTMPVFPSSERTVTFQVDGAGVSTYRWSLDGNYIRPSAPVGTPIVISNLTDAAYELRVFPNLPNGVHTNDGYVSYQWNNDLHYGYDCSTTNPVRSTEPDVLADVGSDFTWDGKNNDDIQVYPGWYTIRATARNALNQMIWSKTYVQVEELGGEDSEVASSGSGVQRMHGKGDWVVWVDRSGEQWQVWARNVAMNTPAFAVTSADTTQDRPKTDGRYVVWQGRQEDSTWAVYSSDLTDTNRITQVLSALTDTDETNPSIDWPWVVWQRRDVRNVSAPHQLYAKNLISGEERFVDPTTTDQLDPQVETDRVVWQDWRDVGPGEIYLQDLETSNSTRITENPAGQYRPSISGPVVVWQDNRNGQLDLYSFDLRNRSETRLTETPYDESSPVINGQWVFFAENSLNPDINDLRLLHLASLRSAPMTRSATRKEFPALLTGHTAWLDETAKGTRIISGALPSLRGVYAERNAVPVTTHMLESASTSFELLEHWRTSANLIEVLAYEQLWPEMVVKRAWRDQAGQLQGDDFALDTGMFVWLGFDRAQLIDFGPSESEPIDLPEGVSVLTYSGFPVGYSAFDMIRQIGPEKIRALRMHDPSAGRWLTVQMDGARRIGADFEIPRIAVIFIDMDESVSQWKPE